MGWRFRRRVRILPGLWFNISKSGGSVSIGGRGATLNLGSRGARTTVGLPGSGLSYRSATQPWGHGAPTRPAPALRPANANHAPAGRRVLLRLGIIAAIAAGLAYLSH